MKKFTGAGCRARELSLIAFEPSATTFEDKATNFIPQLYLSLSIICFALPALSEDYRHEFYIHILAYTVPLAQICLYGSCYSTVALTIERC